MTRRRGMTLVEVVMALTVVAVGVTALQRLAARSVATVAADADITRALVVARSLLAESALGPGAPGVEVGERAGLRFERQTRPAIHPSLREVVVRVHGADGGTCELVEVVRVPPA